MLLWLTTFLFVAKMLFFRAVFATLFLPSASGIIRKLSSSCAEAPSISEEDHQGTAGKEQLWQLCLDELQAYPLEVSQSVLLYMYPQVAR